MKKKMTDKQAKVCDEYMIDLNATQAAIRAGYSKKTAKEQGCQNLTKLNIQEELAKRKEKLSKETGVTLEYVIDGLKEVSQRCLQRKPVIVFNREKKRKEQAVNDNGEGVWAFDSSGANRSFELLGKHLGAFVEKHQLVGENGEPLIVNIILKPDKEKT